MEFDVSLFWRLLFCIELFVNVSGRQDHADIHMQHVGWNDNWFFHVVQPDNLRYFYKIRPAKDFGPLLSHSHHDVELVPAEPIMACSSLTNSIYIRNSVALIRRGECSFVTKVLHAEEAGAIAVVIYNFDEDNTNRYIDMIGDGTDRKVKIASFFLLGKNGFMIDKTLKDLGLRSALINIPINGSRITEEPLLQPPWVVW